MSALHWLAFAGGIALALSTWWSVIGTLIVPRPINNWVSRYTGHLVNGVFHVGLRPVHSYRVRDRVLAWQGPTALFVRLIVWGALFEVAYALMLLPFVRGRHLSTAFQEAGSGLFTLGYAAPSRVGSTAIVYLAAFSGLVVVALQIGYLPTLYSAFNRREADVTLLVSRAGAPSWGPELLARTRFGLQTVDGEAELSSLYQRWERWAAEVAESHTTYTTLCWLRSPRPNSNWLLSLLSVMDAAAMQLSVSPSTVPALRARLAIRMGFTCMNDIAQALGVSVVEDPDPDLPILLGYEEYAAAVEHLRSVDYPVEVSTEQSWPHFRGWRVNYEAVAYRLAYLIDAPPALWSGPRRWAAQTMPPSRPANRIAREVRTDDPQLARRARNTVQRER
jgi:hypothetical protein